MSYYSSKNPGLYLYLTLIIASTAFFLLCETTSSGIGILAMLWGGFTALRALSLYEIDAYYDNYKHQSTLISKAHNAQSSSLAHDLMQRMNSNVNMKQGLHALSCLHKRTLFWFVLALGYTALILHTNASFMNKTSLMEMICTLFMIGAAFWSAQSYAYNKTVATLLSTVFSITLCVSFFSLPITTVHISEVFHSTFSAQNLVLGFLILYSITIMLHAIGQKNKAELNIFGALILIALLTLCHLTMEPSSKATALWLSGWGLFSVFWARAYQPIKKHYILHQCD